MRVKIGDTWYSAKDQPIMIEVDLVQREQIYTMPKDSTRYCIYDDDYLLDHTQEEIFEWISDGGTT